MELLIMKFEDSYAFIKKYDPHPKEWSMRVFKY